MTAKLGLDIRRTLRTNPHLQGLPDHELERLAMSVSVRTLRRKEPLFSEGETPGGVYLLESGWLKAVRSVPDGSELVVGVMGPTDGLASNPGPSMPGPHEATVRALTTARVLSVRGLAAADLLRECPALLEAWRELYYADRRRHVELTVGLALHDIDRRLAKLLLRLARMTQGAGGPGSPPELEVPKVLSQREMAAAVGTAREVVTRHVAALVEQGILARRGRRIVLAQPERLRAMAEGD